MSGLSGFDDVADKVPVGGKQGLKGIADGDYQMQIEKAEIVTGQYGTQVKMKMIILTDGLYKGVEVDNIYYLTNKDKKTGTESLNETSVGIVKKDLEVMGFDVGNWTKANGHPLSAQLPKATATITAVKPVVNCKKSTSGDGKYHNLYLNERVILPSQPEKFSQEFIDKCGEGEDLPF